MKIERSSIPYFVKIEDRSELKDRILHYYRDADLGSYPLYEYKANKDLIESIKIGENVSAEIWDLPLRIVNDARGRDSVTLRELSEGKIVVLDFWATWCKPCLESMDNWKDIYPKYKDNVLVIGFMLDYDFKATLTIEDKGWTMPQIVGPEVYFLNAYFSESPIIGPSAWILKNKFLGMTDLNVDVEGLLNQMISGEIISIPLRSLWKGGGV